MSKIDFSGIDGLLISDPVNISYLTGFFGLNKTEREAYILLTGQEIYLFTIPLYLEKVRKMEPHGQARGTKITPCWSEHPCLAGRQAVPSRQLFRILMNGGIGTGIKISGLKVVEFSQDVPFAEVLNNLLNDLKIRRLGFEENDLSYKEYRQLQRAFRRTKLIPVSKRIENLRVYKNHQELTNIKSACELTDLCFDHIRKLLKTGISETQVAWEIEKFIRKNNAQIAFPPVVAFDANSSEPHHIPSKSCRLKADSLILLDFGAKVNGYCADMTRVLFISKPSVQQKQVYETVLHIYKKILRRFSHILIYEKKSLKTAAGGQLDQYAKDLIKQAGFPPYPHGLGHGVGLEIHEDPRLNIKKPAMLKSGMVFTLEPAIYLPGKFGVRIENTVLLNKDGVEVLTKSPLKSCSESLRHSGAK